MPDVAAPMSAATTSGETSEKLEAMTRVFEVFSDVLTGKPRVSRTVSPLFDTLGDEKPPAKSMKTMEAAFQTLQTIVSERASLQVGITSIETVTIPHRHHTHHTCTHPAAAAAATGASMLFLRCSHARSVRRRPLPAHLPLTYTRRSR